MLSVSVYLCPVSSVRAIGWFHITCIAAQKCKWCNGFLFSLHADTGIRSFPFTFHIPRCAQPRDSVLVSSEQFYVKILSLSYLFTYSMKWNNEINVILFLFLPLASSWTMLGRPCFCIQTDFNKFVEEYGQCLRRFSWPKTIASMRLFSPFFLFFPPCGYFELHMEACFCHKIKKKNFLFYYTILTLFL